MNVEWRTAGDETLELRRAILLYEQGGAALATVHGVMVDKDGAARIGSGVCLTRDVLDDMVRRLAGLSRHRSILADRMVVFDGGLMGWWTPAAWRPIFFRTRDAAWDEEMSGKIVLHPPLLFLARPGRLQAYALARSERPEPDTPLFYAPYPNVYETGFMCQGNVALPSILQPDDLAIWETAFFETYFTHSNMGGKKLCRHPGGEHAMWRHLSTWEDGIFPSEWLEPAKTPLANKDIGPMSLLEAVNR